MAKPESTGRVAKRRQMGYGGCCRQRGDEVKRKGVSYRNKEEADCYGRGHLSNIHHDYQRAQDLGAESSQGSGLQGQDRGVRQSLG